MNTRIKIVLLFLKADFDGDNNLFVVDWFSTKCLSL